LPLHGGTRGNGSGRLRVIQTRMPPMVKPTCQPGPGGRHAAAHCSPRCHPTSRITRDMPSMSGVRASGCILASRCALALIAVASSGSSGSGLGRTAGLVALAAARRPSPTSSETKPSRTERGSGRSARSGRAMPGRAAPSAVCGAMRNLVQSPRGPHPIASGVQSVRVRSDFKWGAKIRTDPG
jgi:hypothetical protein